MARTKYKKKYARELINGIRRKPYVDENGREYSWSIERLCWHWGISETTYRAWKEEFKSFAEACEIGDRDYKIYWMEKIEDGVALGKSANGSLLKLLAGNILGMSDKKEVTTNAPENQLKTININVLPPPQRKEINVIDITEHERIKHQPD